MFVIRSSINNCDKQSNINGKTGWTGCVEKSGNSKQVACCNVCSCASINEKKLVAQHDDINGDGTWDEVAFLYSFKLNEKITIKFSSTNSNEATGTVQRAHVRLRKKNAENTFRPYVIV